MRPLDGIKVLDLTRLLPGEFCSMILGDFGAEVIKVEDTIQGDYARWINPLFTETMMDETISAYFAVLNRNKKSVKLNLKMEKGAEAFMRLVSDADVVLESFRPGVMDKLGIGYNALKEINPQIICCALSGYGQTGPYRLTAGHDINYLAIAGLLGMQGIRGGQPILSGVQIADIGGGVQMALAGILLAILAREKTGKGQFVDIAMMDGAMSWLAMHAGNYWGDGREPKRGEQNLNGGYACYNVYKTGDGRYLAVGALEEKFWMAFLKTLDKEELFTDHLAGLDRQAEMIGEIQKIIITKTLDEWISIFQGVDACVSPVNSLAQAFADPQIKDRKMMVPLTYRNKQGAEKTLLQLGIPIKLSETPGRMVLGPPQYGQHTTEVLFEIGYSSEEIEQLYKASVC